jgi:hypothetical protein
MIEGLLAANILQGGTVDQLLALGILRLFMPHGLGWQNFDDNLCLFATTSSGFRPHLGFISFTVVSSQPNYPELLFEWVTRGPPAEGWKSEMLL